MSYTNIFRLCVDEHFDNILYRHIKERCGNERPAKKDTYQLMIDSCETKLGKLLGCYRNMLKIRSETEPDMHRTLCGFLRLELEFFLKFKKYIEAIPEDNERSNDPAEDLLEGYPLALFNESLMEFFDACMAYSEGQVREVTIFTKRKYDEAHGWHLMLMT